MSDKKRILVVDDEVQMVEMLKLRLEANNYDVISAFDGESGLDAAKKKKPDLIILDLMLPKMDGYKVCGLLKKDPSYAEIPIIIFTAKAQAKDINLGKEAGAEAYLTKPYEPEILLGKIKEVLGEA